MARYSVVLFYVFLLCFVPLSVFSQEHQEKAVFQIEEVDDVPFGEEISLDFNSNILLLKIGEQRCRGYFTSQRIAGQDLYHFTVVFNGRAGAGSGGGCHNWSFDLVAAGIHGKGAHIQVGERVTALINSISFYQHTKTFILTRIQ